MVSRLVSLSLITVFKKSHVSLVAESHNQQPHPFSNNLDPDQQHRSIDFSGSSCGDIKNQ